jgi:O-antigen/teichoic acid export membrane protein
MMSLPAKVSRHFPAAWPGRPWHDGMMPLPSRARRHFGDGFASTLVAQVGVLALGAFTGVASARLLGPQGRGELAALILWPTVLVMLASLGMNQAIVYYTGSQRYPLAQVWTASTLIGAAQSLCVVGAGLLVVPWALRAYSPEVRHLALLFLFSTPFLMLGGYPGNLFQGKLDLFPFNVIRMLAPLVYALGLAVLLLRHQASLQSVVALQILGFVLALAGGYGLLGKKERLRFSVDRGALKSLLSYGGKTQLATVTTYVNQRLDQLLLSLFVSPPELGLYVVAVTVSMLLGFFPQATAMVTLAAGSNAPREDARAVIAHSFRTSLVWLVVGCSALFLAAPWLITGVFGARFQGAVLACRILLPGSVALGLNQILAEGARSLNQPALPSYAEGLSAVLTCVGLYVLLPRLGFLGAALASTVAYTASLLFMLVLYHVRLRIPGRELVYDFPRADRRTAGIVPAVSGASR